MSEEPIPTEEPVEVTTQQQLADSPFNIANELDRLAPLASNLVETRPEFRQLIGAMLASRQLYAMCVYELELLCEPENLPNLPDTETPLTYDQVVWLREVLVNAAAVQAQQPFEEETLFRGMTETVFPWMKQVVVKHSDAQAAIRKRAREEREQSRVSTPIHLGFPFFDETASVDSHKIYRSRPVLFVGQRDVLSWLMQHITAHLLTGDHGSAQTVRLTGPVVRSENPRLVTVPDSSWSNCANTNNGFQKIYDSVIAPQLSDPIDLLIVDDLLTAYRGYAQTPRTTAANEAQRKLKNWTDVAGALLVGCLPLDRPLRADELNSPEYEMLRIHNIVRGVDAVATASGYTIRAGNQVVAEISKEALEAHRVSPIIQV